MTQDATVAAHPRTGGLREEKKRKTRERLVLAARELFERHGFDGTSIEDIAEAAGVSRRTFFRYFATKEDIAFPFRATRLQRFDSLMQTRNAGESGWEAVKRALVVLAGDLMQQRPEIVSFERIAYTTPSLRGARREFDRGWEQRIAEAVSTDSDDSVVGARSARLLAGATMGLIRAALDCWVEDEGESNLIELAHQGFALLDRGSGTLAGLELG